MSGLPVRILGDGHEQGCDVTVVHKAHAHRVADRQLDVAVIGRVLYTTGFMKERCLASAVGCTELALRPCIFGKNEISSPSLGMQAPITETLTTNGAVGGAVTAY